MEWTKEQKRIIDLRDSNVLVSAAAGSGKTAVLVERVIQLVRDQNEEIDSFLVVTFTNAAAAGMKQKIQKALVKAIKEGTNTKHLRKQLSQLSKAQITTFHSFCLDVIRGHFNEVGLDPGFKIGDMNELESLYRDVIDQVLEESYKEGSEPFKTLVECFSSNRYDTEIFDLVDRVYRFIQSFPEPHRWINESVDLLRISKDELDGSRWNQELFKHVRMQLNGARRMLEEAIKNCELPGGPEVYIDCLKEELSTVDTLAASTDKGLESFLQTLYGVEFKKIPSATAKKYPDIDQEIRRKVKEDLRDKAKDIVTSIKGIYIYEEISQYTDDINHMHESVNELKNLVQRVDDLYTEKKRERSLLDYNDLERYALQILTQQPELPDLSKGLSPSEIALEFRNKFKYVFVDEYQDINTKQEAIIDQIKREDNLFMVGDVKQSIYRFRLADPSIFNYKYKTFKKDSEDLGIEEINRVIELNRNFRSRKEILDSTNRIFSRIMSEEIGEVDYSENVYLNNGKTDFIKEEFVEMNFINLNKESGNSDYTKDEEADDSDSTEAVDDELKFLSQAEFEAIFAANKVKDLLKEYTHDDSEEGLRKIEYKDVVILIRAVSSWAGVFEETFRKEGIPFYFDGGGGYFSAMEIQIVVNLLKILDNTNQDIPLLSVMRSPIGKFSTRELTEIRSRFKRGTFVDACKQYIEGLEEGTDIELNEVLQHKLKNFFGFLYKWTAKSRLVRTDELIWEILMETEYYEMVGSMENGKLRQANLRMLVDRANEYTKGTSRGLFDFLKYIEKISEKKEDKTSSAKTLGENDNVVRLMSIHNSKGLEFPVVILCGLNKGFNKTDTRNPILMHKDLGIGSKYVDHKQRVKKDTLGRTAIGKKNEIEGLSEEMRILYVGMTRAIDRLIMVGTINSLEEKANTWTFGSEKYFLYKAKSFMDWIGLSLFGGLDPEEIGKTIQKGAHHNIHLNMISTAEIAKDKNDTEKYGIEEKLGEIRSFNDQEIYDEVSRRLSFSYPFKDSGKAPSKLSVTSLKHASLDPQGTKHDVPILSEMLDYDGDASKLEDGMKLVGTEIGTLVHLVLEHIDLREEINLDGLEKQIHGFVESNMITERQFEFIREAYLDKIYGFLISGIGTRMRKSANIKKEVPFIIKKKAAEVFQDISGDDSIFIQGIIDCYFEEDCEIVIVDYKTDRLKGRTPQQLADEYRVQISSYKEAIEKITKKRVKESYLYLFSVGEQVQVD
ncbi:helicase-exonuclease AddAB subunit AddA [Gudongella sp. DL1XJH-153]|uniref:helicase-exonuclease AddAB subunit AddA n=1 Tax=Gudongella sp. DL1XJH-153 TaxID=3409804 RepID=UPI003BB65ABC